MVHLAKDGFSALITYDGRWVCIKTQLGPEFSCSLDDLSTVLSGCTLQVSEASGAYLLITPSRHEITIVASTADGADTSGCLIASEEFAGYIRDLRRKNPSSNGALGG